MIAAPAREYQHWIIRFAHRHLEANYGWHALQALSTRRNILCSADSDPWKPGKAPISPSDEIRGPVSGSRDLVSKEETIFDPTSGASATS
eukprot:263214-Hanusia_phi.AAC.2